MREADEIAAGVETVAMIITSVQVIEACAQRSNRDQ